MPAFNVTLELPDGIGEVPKDQDGKRLSDSRGRTPRVRINHAFLLAGVPTNHF